MTDLQIRESADRIEAKRVRLADLRRAGARHAMQSTMEAFWCPADDVDTWNPDSQVSRQYLQYLAGGQDPRD
jgi:hypothetical protein